MDAWYRHFEKDCSHSLAIDYEFSRKERVRRGAFDMRSFFTKPGARSKKQWRARLLVLGRISSCSIFVDATLVKLPAGGRGRQVRAGLRRRPQHLCERRHQPHPGGMPSVVDFVVHGGGGGPSMDGPTLHSAQSRHGGIPPRAPRASAVLHRSGLPHIIRLRVRLRLRLRRMCRAQC